MSLEAKMDELIVSLNKNTEALLAAAGAGVAVTTKTVTAGKTTTKKAAATSEHSADEVKARFNELKADKANLPKLKKIIADLGASSLDELVGKVDLLDQAWAALETVAAPAEVEEEDDL